MKAIVLIIVCICCAATSRAQIFEVTTQKDITIDPREWFSSQKLAVKKGQRYRIYADSTDLWQDSRLDSCNANGCKNRLAEWAGLRVRKAKCFTLCGAYNDDKKKLFKIGLDTTITIPEDGKLSFFANDSRYRWVYKNNKGWLTVHIVRLI